MSDTGAPEVHPRRQNGAAVLIGILVAGLVAGVFMLTQSGGDVTSAPRSGAGSSEPPSLSPAPEAQSPERSPEPPDVAMTSPAPSGVDNREEPAPLAEDEKPPDNADYDECVAWWEARGYNADNCQSPDPEWESLLAAASARASKAAIPLPAPSVSPTTLVQINVQKCRVFRHSMGYDPDECSKIPDIEYIDADKVFALEEGCSRDARDLPGVSECGGEGYEPEIDPEGDDGVDSVTTFAPDDWAIDADFYGSGDQDSRGLEWGGGAIVVELTTEARAASVSITDKYGEHVAPTESSGRGRRIQATLPAGRYIVHVWTAAKSGRVPYRLTLTTG